MAPILEKIPQSETAPPPMGRPVTEAPAMHQDRAQDATPCGGSFQPSFESWGRYPRHTVDRLVPIHWRQEIASRLAGPRDGALAVGMGRSYGDSCQLAGRTLLEMTGMNRLLHFDPETGLLTAEAGITLGQILDFAVPRGFFLPVTPGTKYVTLGGAIANDIHGKNHHGWGTFGNHVTWLELIRSDGSCKECSLSENPEWFRATIGGLGLTGVISRAQLRLRPIVSRMIDYVGIQFHGIDEFLALTERHQHAEYTVSWIDCASTGRNFARGVFMRGEHSTIPGALNPSPEPKLVFPFEAPAGALNHATVSLFNTVFFHKQGRPRVEERKDYEPFFYPLDKVLRWNRMYGKDGLLQFALPWESSREGTIAMMRLVANSGLASFLAVLKAFGSVASPGLLSFPMPGVTLALDFPIRAGQTLPLVERLASMTLEYGGRINPSKDATMTAAQFQSSYPRWSRLERFRDPALSSSFWERVTEGHGHR